jgi:hypothetical protein
MADPFEATEILHNRFVRVEHHAGLRLVQVTRSAEPMRLEDIDEGWGSVVAALAPLERSDQALLMDMRLARGRNDDAYERAVARHRADTVAGFRRVAVLVRSVPGALQVQRHVKEDKLAQVRVFSSESDALAWLAEG